ncbi:MAG TPA: prenyltransferase/squalene oxidase repeat-containing protein [Planctomycetota bacterium]
MDEPTTSSSPRPRSLLRRVLKMLLLLALLIVLAGAYLYFFELPHHSTPTLAAEAIKPSGDPALDAIRRGVEFLRVHQEADGEFSCGLIDPKPGYTALVVDSVAHSPDKCRENTHPFLAKAAAAILKHQQPNGSIATPSMSLDTYTTAVSVMALTALENPAYAKAVERAKEYLISVQYRDDESNPNFGAAGYKPGGRTSGDVTSMWIEALKDAGVKEGDPAFTNAQKFLSRLQNDSELNKNPAPGTEVGDDGGFIYRPGESKPKDDAGKNGLRIPKSYGLMSYAGLKSFLYMNVGKEDPRVRSAWRWVRDNYTLEENRNIGADGLYYYFLTMAKALSAYGEPELTTTDGKKHLWAQELSQRLISLQEADGCWRNKQSDRWSENDSVMVTAFAIRTLGICQQELQKQKESTQK